jgi:hypothetical protein
MAKKAAFLVNVETGAKFIWTEKLAGVPGMAPCDAEGKIVHGGAAVQETLAGAPEQQPAASVPVKKATVEDFKDLLAAMDREELAQKAEQLGVEFASNIGTEKLRERVLTVVSERLEKAQADLATAAKDGE